MGLSGSILVKGNIPKSKFHDVFDIREDYSLCIQNMRIISLLSFPIKKFCEKSFFIGSLF